MLLACPMCNKLLEVILTKMIKLAWFNQDCYFIKIRIPFDAEFIFWMNKYCTRRQKVEMNLRKVKKRFMRIVFRGYLIDNPSDVWRNYGGYFYQCSPAGHRYRLDVGFRELQPKGCTMRATYQILGRQIYSSKPLPPCGILWCRKLRAYHP